MEWAKSWWLPGGSGEMPDGIYYPKQLALLGAGIWRRSNHTIVPDPAYLASLDPRWITTLNVLDDLIEKANPNRDG